MKIAGVIAEYNPFHNGHAYQLRKTRELTGCDAIVVCMSGHFTQRGEAACLSKWDRARAAIACGADAVVELPALWAVRTADAFARGGVHILGALGCDCLSFGCETEDMALLNRLAELRAQEPEALRAAVRTGLAAGMTQVRARAAAVEAQLGLAPGSLNYPNLTLATEYLCALRTEKSGMQPVPVRREGDYRDAALGSFASAGALRTAIAEGRAEAAELCVPEAARAAFRCAESPLPADDLLLWQLRNSSAESLHGLLDMGEGLENRILRCAKTAPDRAALLNALDCRRYTRARLNRLLLYAQLNITQSFAKAHPLPDYARLIALRGGAEPLMRELKARTTIPLCAASGALRENPVFQLEMRATDLWALTRSRAEERTVGQEFTRKFVRF